ncbi:hypothetical protein [Pseudomonas proteolytica]|uniref:hypothetical protein n=1 Tax=Pseudomonas proteolytica TaxID=219574 RepID=UPI0030DC1268
MLKVKCSSCNAKVVSTDKKCPECGIENPGKGKVSPFEALVSLAMIPLMFWGVISLKNVVVEWYDQKVVSSVKADAARDLTCKRDLQCWAEKHIGNVEVDCGPAVERIAKYSSRWTTTSMQMKFSSFRWKNRESLTVTYFGDRIEFQNGYGAFQVMTYSCDYDPASKKVLAVSVTPGRL